MKNKYLLLIFLYFISLSTTCIRKKDIENTLCIENRLDCDLYIIANYDYPNYDKNTFPKSMLKVNPQYQVLAKDSSRVGLWGICQKHIWEQLALSDTVHILILNKDSIDNGIENSFREYLENKKYIREYKLTYDDIIEKKCKLIIE